MLGLKVAAARAQGQAPQKLLLAAPGTVNVSTISSPSSSEDTTPTKSNYSHVILCSLTVHPIPITAGQEKSQPLVERIQGSTPSSAYWLAVPSHGPSLCLHLPATKILAKCFEIPRKKVTELAVALRDIPESTDSFAPAQGMQWISPRKEGITCREEAHVVDTSLKW